MKVLVTGARGFVGKNLVETLKNIRDKKKRDIDLNIDTIYEYDINNKLEDLDIFCSDCDFVFHLAGVNRPTNVSEFQSGNVEFSKQLLKMLQTHHNVCPIMVSSSIQATLLGRYENSLYGQSKLAGEELFFEYEKLYGNHVLVYRFPNLFGKWCRPNYNSVIATFCNAVANDLPYTVNNSSTELELLYIDDLVNEMINVLAGREHRCNYDGLVPVEDNFGRYCYVPMTYHMTLGQIVNLLESFKQQSKTLLFEPMPEGSFEKKLYSTYLSFLPKSKTIFDLSTSVDVRGSFTEFFKSIAYGQFSINISKPGTTKGQHWHNTKMEIFLVVSGHGLVQERRIGTDESGKPYPVRKYEVSGEKLQCIYILPGYTHNLINLSETENMVTVIWANEIYDPEHPETYYEEV